MTSKRESKKGLWAKLIVEVGLPILFVVFSVIAAILLHFLNLPESVCDHCEHAITILIIALLGWTAIGITRAFYRSFVEKTEGAISLDLGQRSLLTQVLFLYRLAIFVILAITAAAILLTFPYIKSLGVGILGSAGIAGIVLGIAAKPILLNLMVGFQIAFTKMIKIGDAIFVENEFARIETIHLTRVIVCTWDWRRIVIPISYFIDKPFQNWDLKNTELLGYIFLYCDYSVPVDAVRKKAEELITQHPLWNKKAWSVQVTDATEQAIQIRVVASANDASSTFELRVYLREKLIDFLQKEYPAALPRVRNYQVVDEHK